MPHAIFIFPGQGSQTIGMGLDLAAAYPSAQAVLDAADAALDAPITPLIADGPIETLTLSHNAQPAITAVNLAILAVMREKGVTPIATAGHSLGEYAANAAAGVFDAATAVRLTRTRGSLMQACADEHPGLMVAVMGLPMERIDTICAEITATSGQSVSVANYNSPEQIVITGETAAVEAAAKACQEAGAKRCITLPVSGPWHSALMADAQEAFGKYLAGEHLSEPTISLFANVDATEKKTAAEVLEALSRQICSPVRWIQTVATLAARFPGTPFVEVGPGKVLRGLMRRIDPSLTCLNVEDVASLDATLAALEA